jgi:hypothetical protein
MISPRSLLRWMLPAVLLAAGVATAQAPAPAAPAAAPAAAAPAPVPADAPRVPRTLDIPDNALVAAGPAPQLDILYTGDVIGFIEPCG